MIPASRIADFLLNANSSSSLLNNAWFIANISMARAVKIKVVEYNAVQQLHRDIDTWNSKAASQK